MVLTEAVEMSGRHGPRSDAGGDLVEEETFSGREEGKKVRAMQSLGQDG